MSTFNIASLCFKRQNSIKAGTISSTHAAGLKHNVIGADNIATSLCEKLFIEITFITLRPCSMTPLCWEECSSWKSVHNTKLEGFVDRILRPLHYLKAIDTVVYA